MLTGDNECVARAARRRLGLTSHIADMLPADKAEATRELKCKGGIVAMVCNRINDSPALAHADVGIAMRHSGAVTHESAHVMLMEDSIVKAIFVVRAAFSRLVANATAGLLERGAAAASAPAMIAMVTAIAPRFGLEVYEHAAASALPVVGALGGATLNMLFVRHFQRTAHGHFMIRRLERQYGREVVRAYYRGLVLETAPRRGVRR